jgi:hypothetical protein
MKKLAALVLLGLATAAAPANAADSVVATVAKQTPIDAFGGRAVWSTWDPAAAAYRLTVYNGGRVRNLPVAPSASPFQADLGEGSHGGTVAIYSRCSKPVEVTVDTAGRRGCDLYLYRFATAREVKITRANSKADETWPTVWHNRIAFVRESRVRPFTAKSVAYWRPLAGKGPWQRLRKGREEVGSGSPEELDMRGNRIAFINQYEWGADLRTTMIGGRGRVLVAMPGSGAEVFDLTGQGPTVGRRTVHWALSIGQDSPVFSEIRQVDLTTLAEKRATARIDAPDSVDRATQGFAQDAGTSWYVEVPAPDAFEIHRATGLQYEPAPRPRAPHN